MSVTIKDYQNWLNEEKNKGKIKVAKEGETLSSFDELENKALYNQYVKEAELFNQRKEAEAQVKAQTESALRDALSRALKSSATAMTSSTWPKSTGSPIFSMRFPAPPSRSGRKF